MGVALGHIARAAPPPSLRVGGEELACPTPGQVAAVLKRLLLHTLVTVTAGPLGPDDASISDQGAQFRVTVAGQERTFADAVRGCDERAKHAAVFVALVLDPPMIAEPPVEPSIPAPAPVAPTAEPRPLASSPVALQWDLALGAILLVAPAAPDRRASVAGGVDAWVRGKRGFHLGFGMGLLHGTLDFDTAAADAWWVPIDVAAGFTVKPVPWEVGAEIGPSASVLSILGQNLQQAHRQVRVEVGGRASTWARFWFDKKFALFLSADAVLHPIPYVLQINPEGEVGQMPVVWLGASAGLSAALE
jgi:hypothetical protein